MIFAIDPGQKICGYAVVAPGALGRVRFLEAGTFASTLKDFQSTLRRWAGPLPVTTTLSPLTIAIETPSGYIHDPFRGPPLLDTQWAAGGMAWVAEHMGIKVVPIAAANVRKAVVGKARLGGKARKGDMDKLVKLAINGLVEGMPKATNVHVRDALAIAICVHWMQIGRAA